VSHSCIGNSNTMELPLIFVMLTCVLAQREQHVSKTEIEIVPRDHKAPRCFSSLCPEFYFNREITNPLFKGHMLPSALSTKCALGRYQVVVSN